MTEILPPNRQQLAEFISNHETIRRFEILFRMVGEDLPEAIINNSESALAAANNALAAVNSLAAQVGNDLAAAEARTAYALELAERLQRQIYEMRFYIHAVQEQ